MKKLFAFLLLASALGNCQQPAVAPAATTQGQVVRYQTVTDSQGQHPRVRWIVQLAAPLTVKGWNNHDYSQVKVFGLPDTVVFRAGTRFYFNYEVVPEARQTPWKTGYEWLAVPPGPPGYTPNPELALSAVKLP